MTGTMAISQEIVAQELIAGNSMYKALTKAGYSKTTAHGKPGLVCKSLQIEDYIEKWKQDNAQKQLETLTQSNVSGLMLKNCRDTIELVDNPAVKAKLQLEYAKITSKRSQDLLDRAGVSKISKSMRITSKVDAKSIDDVRQRIQQVMDKLNGNVSAAPKTRGRKAVTITATVVKDASQDSTQTAPLAHSDTQAEKVMSDAQSQEISAEAQAQCNTHDDSTDSHPKSQDACEAQNLDLTPGGA